MVAPPVVEMESNGQGIAETRGGHTRQRKGKHRQRHKGKTRQINLRGKTKQDKAG